MISSSSASGAVSRTNGEIFVLKKWSGHDVPKAASFSNDCLSMKSRTTSESVKCPTMRESVDATPRSTAESLDARARRSASGNALNFATTAPNGSVLP